jgi:hypothetical protein
MFWTPFTILVSVAGLPLKYVSTFTLQVCANKRRKRKDELADKMALWETFDGARRDVDDWFDYYYNMSGCFHRTCFSLTKPMKPKVQLCYSKP